jgi:hypothetical protein
LLTAKAKKLLVLESALISTLAIVLLALIFFPKYTLHFQQVTLNYYTNGKTDFTANATNLVRSLGMVAELSLVFGAVAGAAVAFTISTHFTASNSTPTSGGYEEQVAKMGFVVVHKTDEGTTYKLTDLGRRFLRDYRFLEKTEAQPNLDPSSYKLESRSAQ